MSAAPVAKDIHRWPDTMLELPSLIITLHLDLGRCTPSPKKLSPTVLRMAQERFILDHDKADARMPSVPPIADVQASR